MAGKTVRLGGGDADEYLPVYVEGRKTPYKLPLMSSLPVRDVMAMRKALKLPEEERADAYMDVFYGVVCKFIPQKVVDTLTFADLTNLAEVWGEAGGDEGES